MPGVDGLILGNVATKSRLRIDRKLKWVKCRDVVVTVHWLLRSRDLTGG